MSKRFPLVLEFICPHIKNLPIYLLRKSFLNYFMKSPIPTNLLLKHHFNFYKNLWFFLESSVLFSLKIPILSNLRWRLVHWRNGNGNENRNKKESKTYSFVWLVFQNCNLNHYYLVWLTTEWNEINYILTKIPLLSTWLY